MYAIINIAQARFDTPRQIMYASSLEGAEKMLAWLESKGVGTGSSDWQHVIVPMTCWDRLPQNFNYWSVSTSFYVDADGNYGQDEIREYFEEEDNWNLGQEFIDKLSGGNVETRVGDLRMQGPARVSVHVSAWAASKEDALKALSDLELEARKKLEDKVEITKAIKIKND